MRQDNECQVMSSNAGTEWNEEEINLSDFTERRGDVRAGGKRAEERSD